MNRRDFLWHSGGGLGGIAAREFLLAAAAAGGLACASLARRRAGPTAALHHPPKAKRVVQLFMAGAASHVDLFDYKPELVKRHGQPSDFGEHVEAFQNGLGPWLKPVWDFKPYGQCGKMLSEVVAPLGDVVDEIAFVHNMVGKTGVHSQGTLLQTTGFNRPGFPGDGLLGQLRPRQPERQPADVRRPARPPRPRLERHQELGLGVPARAAPGHRHLPRHARRPIADLFPDERGDVRHARRATPPAIDLLAQLNREHAASRARRRAARRPHPQLRTGRQDAARRARGARHLEGARGRPQALRPRPRQDVVRQGDQRRSRRPTTSAASAWSPAGCSSAGVRFVQIWSGNDNGFPRRNWDSHEDVERDHGPLALRHGPRGARR